MDLSHGLIGTLPDAAEAAAFPGNAGDEFLTAQIPPDEVSAYMEGSAPAVLRITRGTCSPLLRFVRNADGLISVSVPLRKHDAVELFDIIAATDVPTFTAARDIECDCVRFTIRTRSELRNVIALAANHLNWLNDDEIEYCFTES